MPALRISVGFVVKPAIRSSRYSASIPARLAPSAKILTRSRSTLGADARAVGSEAIIVIALHLDHSSEVWGGKARTATRPSRSRPARTVAPAETCDALYNGAGRNPSRVGRGFLRRRHAGPDR